MFTLGSLSVKHHVAIVTLRHSAIFTFIDLTTRNTDPVRKYSTNNFPTIKSSERKFRYELYLKQTVRFDIWTIDNFLSLKESGKF